MPLPIGAGLFFRQILPDGRNDNEIHLATLRPWRELFASPASYSMPRSCHDFCYRLKHNLNHFRVNYAMIILLILFLSLRHRPIPMIVFTVVLIFWYLFYFFLHEPIMLCDRAVDDRAVLICLGVVMIESLTLMHASLNVLVSLLIGAVVVVPHAACRMTEDLPLGEDEAAHGGFVV